MPDGFAKKFLAKNNNQEIRINIFLQRVMFSDDTGRFEGGMNTFLTIIFPI
jgi:hypothetical protein